MTAQKSLSYAHFSGVINASAPLQLKSGPGVLHSVVINTIGATPATITFTDGIGTGVLMASLLQTSGSTACPITAIMDVRFNVGLIIQGNGAGEDITVCFE